MKHRKPKEITTRQKKALELQVREYNSRYHPELKDAIVAISPSGALAIVRLRNHND